MHRFCYSRYNIVQEIAETERVYIKGLQIIQQVRESICGYILPYSITQIYLVPLRLSNIISTTTIEDIFANAEELIPIHTEFHAGMVYLQTIGN